MLKLTAAAIFIQRAKWLNTLRRRFDDLNEFGDCVIFLDGFNLHDDFFARQRTFDENGEIAVFNLEFGIRNLELFSVIIPNS